MAFLSSESPARVPAKNILANPASVQSLKHPWRRFLKPSLQPISAKAALAVTATVMLAYGLAEDFGLYVNTSKSLDLGLYRVADHRGPLLKGEYVMWCPPDTAVFKQAKSYGYIDQGACTGNYGYLMKQIAATAGDDVLIDAQGVWVNGVLRPHSQPIGKDPMGHAIPSVMPSAMLDGTTLRVGQTQVLLMTDVSPTSFDGRYFGLVDLKQIRHVIKPVLTWR